MLLLISSGSHTTTASYSNLHPLSIHLTSSVAATSSWHSSGCTQQARSHTHHFIKLTKHPPSERLCYCSGEQLAFQCCCVPGFCCCIDEQLAFQWLHKAAQHCKVPDPLLHSQITRCYCILAFTVVVMMS
jgi:hypothetical protein